MRTTTTPFEDPEWLSDRFYYPAMYAWARIRPHGVASSLTDRIKHAGKLYSTVTGLQRTRALEHLAAAFRFENWHQLRQHLEHPIVSESGQAADQWVDRLKLLLVLLEDTDPEVPFADEYAQAMELIGSRLSQLAGVPLEKVLDGVCAKLAMADNWKSGLERSPLDAKAPLYTASIKDELLWIEPSMACVELIDLLYNRLPENPTKDQVRKNIVWLKAVLKKQPGFLDGLLALALDEQFLGNTRESLEVVEAALKTTETQLLQGYKGRIEWGVTSNRVYLRMLWLRMEIYQELGEPKKCLAAARRILRLNPRDNQGARFVVPLLQIQLGEFDKALVSSRARRDEFIDACQYLTRAFAQFGAGNHKAFIRDLLAALFDFPWLRCFLLNDEQALAKGESGIRSVEPDVDMFCDFGWPAYQAVPGLNATCWIILNKPAVIKAEQELRMYWNGFWGVRDSTRVGNHEGWEDLKNRLIDQLEEVIGPKVVW
ncbi:hypothetical protein [Pseudomonas sp. GOM6]|uniref:tetratricopeptide repeat protein n=1 Tax=Pseudomonas sp. GOM6 TaxID=3036944 RepID=UPI002409F163|nr:hypothetical protein [Pseudomonas sp. GOM6]MDG1580956.1 hypothetical protein [Pseudomonas sp. GOM6]